MLKVMELFDSTNYDLYDSTTDVEISAKFNYNISQIA
jgi:hypothetical protein